MLPRSASTEKKMLYFLRWQIFARLPWPRLDGFLLLLLAITCSVSLLTLYSAGERSFVYVNNQAIRFAIGFVALAALAASTPQQLRRVTPWLYGASLGLLVLVALFGEGRGAHRWLDLGVLRFQPSEIMKLALPMMLAWYFHRRILPPSWRELGVCSVLVLIPTLLVAEQPDLGTALLIAGAGAFVIFLAGLSWRKIVLILSCVTAAAPLLWQHLHEYQRNRVRVLLDPEADPLGNGWHIIQSKIAVGSGGLFGRGFAEGTQSQLAFLPEKQTDFIFAVFSEDFGWFGVLLLLTLYFAIIARSMWIAMQAGDTFSRLLAGALAMSFFVYVIVNGGMIAGVLPVVGVPLPLVSYGGTSAVSLLASFGILMSIHGNRQRIGKRAGS
jgi:rod shape determining protein RodA